MVHDFYNNLHNKLYGKLISFAKQIGSVDDADKDLYHSSVLLKNMAIVRKEHPVSLDYMIEELSKGSVKLRPVYLKTLSYIRSGRYDEAFDFFVNAVSSPRAKDFCSVLFKMDVLDPYELVSQLSVFIEIMRETRVTKAMKRAEKRSLLITVFATASVLAALVNFVVVVVFLDTLYGIRYIF